MDKTLAGLQHQESEIAEENWSSLEATIYDTALSVLGKSNSKHQDWFNDTDKKLLQERNTARVKKLQVNTRSNRTKLTGTRRSLKQYTREMKSQRWEAKEAEKKDTKELLKWSDRGKWDIEEGYNTAYWPWWWDSNAGESWDYFERLIALYWTPLHWDQTLHLLMKNLKSKNYWMPSLQQTQVKPLEWVVYLQNSENMAGWNSPLACTNWFCISGKLSKDNKTTKMLVLCQISRRKV